MRTHGDPAPSRQEVDATTVRLVDDHGHVQAVLRLRRRDEGFRVEDMTVCSPG